MWTVWVPSAFLSTCATPTVWLSSSSKSTLPNLSAGVASVTFVPYGIQTFASHRAPVS